MRRSAPATGSTASQGPAIGIGLMLMSMSSGCVDVLSYRFLGQVFPSAMTGNVALLGLGIGRGELSAALRNMIAFACFVTGLAGGALLLRQGGDRVRLLRTIAAELVLLLLFAVGWRLRTGEPSPYGLIGVSAVAMGLQSAVAHRIGVAGVSTTYFTGTLTGIVFGLLGAVGPPPTVLRRVLWPVLAFLSYLGGAIGAGWYTASATAPEGAALLPFLPFAAVSVLLVTVAVVRR